MTASRRTSLLGCLLRGRGVLFGNAGAAQGVRQRIVPLVAREFIDRPTHLGHENLGAPGFVPGRGIVNGEWIQNGFLAGTRETLHHVQFLARTPERTTWSEVGGVHHQRVALPMAPRVSSPLPDVRGQVWTPVQRDNANRVVHLVRDRKGALCLHNLYIVVV